MFKGEWGYYRGCIPNGNGSNPCETLRDESKVDKTELVYCEYCNESRCNTHEIRGNIIITIT